MKPRIMNCSRCNEKLKATGFGGYENALRVRLDGGYSEFVDTIVYGRDAQTKHPLGHLLCHQCGHELMKWLGVPESHIKPWHPLDESEPLCGGWVVLPGSSWD
jgi:hypothetical protein